MATQLKVACILLIFIVFFCSSQSLSQSSKITLAVMDFKNNSRSARLDHLERAVTEMLKTELSQCREIVVLEREKIESILSEYALVQAGVIEPKHARELGKLAGAEYIITGEIQKVGSELRLDAHLIRVSTGQILGEKVTGSGEEKLQLMMSVLGQNIIFDLTGKGNHLSELKIHDYRIKYLAGLTGALALTTVIFHADYRKNYHLYHEATDFSDFDRYYNRANRSHKIRNWMAAISVTSAIVTLSLWNAENSRGNRIFAANSPSKLLKFAEKINFSFSSAENSWFVNLRLRF